jgi:hypothetical protein
MRGWQRGNVRVGPSQRVRVVAGVVIAVWSAIIIVPGLEAGHGLRTDDGDRGDGPKPVEAVHGQGVRDVGEAPGLYGDKDSGVVHAGETDGVDLIGVGDVGIILPNQYS